MVTPLKSMVESHSRIKAIVGGNSPLNNPNPNHTSSMDLLFWNYRGTGNCVFKRNFKDLMKNQKPDIVVLMETKVELGTMGMFFHRLGLTSSIHVDPIGRSGGIWLPWNPNQATVRVSQANSQVITATISHQGYPNWI